MKRSEAHGNVVLWRALVIVEARKIARSNPGAYPALEEAFAHLDQSHRDRASAVPDGIPEEAA